MNLKKYCAEVESGKSELSKQMGVSEDQIYQWANGVRMARPESCVRIEALTGGKVTRQELRPNDFWLIWPDLAKFAPTEKA